MKRRKFLALTAALILAATTGLASCGNNSGSKGDTKELNMILYPDYVPQFVIDSFEKETGIKCNIDYVDNDTLIYTKWSEDPKGYDIGQPAISTLHALIDADMLQEISYEDIPNSKYISTDKCDISLNDNDKKYSIPYNTTGGYTWIYNTKTCPVTITKMDDLLDEKLRGQIVTMPYSFMWYPSALMHLGYSDSSTDEKEIAEATEWVKKLTANVKVFDGATPSSSVKNGECSVALTFASDASRALLDDPDLDYLKVEDQTFMQCTQYWVIGKQSPNSKNAEKFIDYICDPKIYAECLNTYPAISNNEEALNYVSDDYKKIEGMFEIPDDKKSYILNSDVPTDALSAYDEQWNKIMSN